MTYPCQGDVWRRSIPPEKEDLAHIAEDNRFLKFCQANASVQITGVWKTSPTEKIVWVDALCGGDIVIFQRDAFLSAYTISKRAPVLRSSIIHDVRDWSPGEKLDGIPLLICPICGKTAFDIGVPLDYLARPFGKERTYVHVVSGLTDSSGRPILSCTGNAKRN